MAGTGILLAFLGWAIMPRRLRGTTFVLIVAGLCTLVLMSGVNFVLDSAFRWLLVVPAVVWALAVLLYARQGLRAALTSISPALNGDLAASLAFGQDPLAT